MQTTTGLVNHLAFQAVQTPDSGLYHGRMGIILSLYCHGDVHDKHGICDYADDLLQNMSTNYYDADISIENGLAGPGLGFTLLYKAELFNDNLNDILYDIDKKIMSVDPRKIEDHSFRKGALGLLFYIRTRFPVGHACVSFHKGYIKELEANMEANAGGTVRDGMLMENVRQPEWEMKGNFEEAGGIDNGSAYYILKDTLQ